MMTFYFKMLIEVILLSMLCSTVRCGSQPTLHDHESTTCEEFGRHARFNPYSVIGSYWFLFYYWGPVQKTVIVNFTVPTELQIKYLRYLLDEHVPEPVDWGARLLLMQEQTNYTALMVEQGDRGQYRLYQPLKGLRPGAHVPVLDMRLKQVKNDRYIGIMACEAKMAFAYSRSTDIPKKVDVQDAAAALGYRGRGGKSYLYQGHQWMPIPEADDTLPIKKKEKTEDEQKVKK